MIPSVLLNGVLGFGVVIPVLFCMGDLAVTLATPTGFELINVGSASSYSSWSPRSIARSRSRPELRSTRLTRSFTFTSFTLGRAGVPMPLDALAYSVFGVFPSFWPLVTQPTPATINQSGVVFGVTLLLCLGFWFTRRWKIYVCSIVELGNDAANEDKTGSNSIVGRNYTRTIPC
jgi:hypothetical protein